MGLDTYIFRIPNKSIEEESLKKICEESEEREQIIYWRKYHNLLDWFGNHYDIENCEDVELDFEVLLLLIETLKNEPKELLPSWVIAEEEEKEVIEGWFEEDIEKLEDITKDIRDNGTKYILYSWW